MSSPQEVVEWALVGTMVVLLLVIVVVIIDTTIVLLRDKP